MKTFWNSLKTKPILNSKFLNLLIIFGLGYRLSYRSFIQTNIEN